MCNSKLSCPSDVPLFLTRVTDLRMSPLSSAAASVSLCYRGAVSWKQLSLRKHWWMTSPVLFSTTNHSQHWLDFWVHVLPVCVNHACTHSSPFPLVSILINSALLVEIYINVFHDLSVVLITPAKKQNKKTLVVFLYHQKFFYDKFSLWWHL